MLLAQLKKQGKYSPVTTRSMVGLAGVLVEQGRYADAEYWPVSLDISRTVGVGDGPIRARSFCLSSAAC